MKVRVVVSAAVLLVVAVVGALLLLGPRRQEWTTSSPRALAELNLGIDALQKVYRNEAAKHFRRALELDPKFVAAKRFLLAALQLPPTDPEAKRLLGELQEADLSKLTDRERFLVSRALADYSKDPAKGEAALKEFVGKHPDDPYALEVLANEATARQDWAEAKRLLTRLIEVAPNRVSAYNQLGYMEMGQGQFAESEKMFETYRYIAPDQANPHDSLGELLILTGQYDRAAQELERALAIRPDFCASYQHLADLALLKNRPDDARGALARAESAGACSPYMLKVLRCQVASWPLFFSGDWQGVWTAEQGPCADDDVNDHVLEVWAALAAGRRADAEARVEKARERLAKTPVTAPARRMAEAVVAHMEGAILLRDGKPADAAERFRVADQGLAYGELGPGIFKLINRFMLARALAASGHAEQAAAVLAEARAVNPGLADRLSKAIAIALGS